jgi:polyisoprenoid-binding protein YceI
MTSLNVQDLSGVGKTRLEGHLRSDDFFSVEANQEAFLILNAVVSDTHGVQILQGDLTIKGKTAPVQVEFSEVTASMARAQMVFDRSVYDVRFRSGSFFENLGDKLIYDDITVQVNLNF